MNRFALDYTLIPVQKTVQSGKPKQPDFNRLDRQMEYHLITGLQYFLYLIKLKKHQYCSAEMAIQ